MLVPLLAAEAMMADGVTENPVPLTLTLSVWVKSLPLTLMILLTEVPVAGMVPTSTVEPLTGAVI